MNGMRDRVKVLFYAGPGLCYADFRTRSHRKDSS